MRLCVWLLRMNTCELKAICHLVQNLTAPHTPAEYVACSMLTKSVRCACCTYHCHILKCVKNERGVKYPNAAHWTCKISTFYEARCYSVLLSDLCVVFTFAGIAMPYHMWTYCCSFIFIFRASANRPTEADTTVYAVFSFSTSDLTHVFMDRNKTQKSTHMEILRRASFQRYLFALSLVIFCVYFGLCGVAFCISLRQRQQWMSQIQKRFRQRWWRRQLNQLQRTSHVIVYK